MVQAQQQDEIIRAYFDAIDEERLDDLMDLFDEGASWVAPIRTPTTDRKVIREFYTDLLDWVRRHKIDRRDTPINIIHGEGQAAVEIDFELKDQDGRSIVAGQGVDIFKFRRGKIASLRITYDSATLLKRTGQMAIFARS